jgi:hypothetical protein
LLQEHTAQAASDVSRAPAGTCICHHASFETVPLSTNTTTLILAFAAASIAWWGSRRPQGWTQEQYLAESAAGCDSTEEEQALAKATTPDARQQATLFNYPCPDAAVELKGN